MDLSAPENLLKKEGHPEELLQLQVDADKLPVGRHTLPVESVNKPMVVIKKIDPPQILLEISRVIEAKRFKIAK